MALVGVYPGSFDPLTVAHLAIAEAARDLIGLARIDLVVSEVPLGKEAGLQAAPASRLARVEAARATRPWLRGRLTTAQLLVEVAVDYDVLVLGADKWHQLLDPAFYGSIEARDEALARLPATVLVAPRAGIAGPVPFGPVRPVVLSLPDWVGEVSSSAVRAGRADWLAQ